MAEGSSNMFKAVQQSHLCEHRAFSVSVGPSTKLTTASWYLQSPADVLLLLEKLVAINEDPGREM